MMQLLGLRHGCPWIPRTGRPVWVGCLCSAHPGWGLHPYYVQAPQLKRWIRQVWAPFWVWVLYIWISQKNTEAVEQNPGEKRIAGTSRNKIREAIPSGIRLLFENLTIKLTHREQTDAKSF